MNHQPSPTGLPGQSGITKQITVPLPVPPVELYEDRHGAPWKLVEDGQDGKLFVPEAVSPAACPRTFWATEAELASSVGPLTRVERAA